MGAESAQPRDADRGAVELRLNSGAVPAGERVVQFFLC